MEQAISISTGPVMTNTTNSNVLYPLRILRRQKIDERPMQAFFSSRLDIMNRLTETCVAFDAQLYSAVDKIASKKQNVQKPCCRRTIVLR